MIKNKLINLLQLLLVVVYIIFEEIVWESFAKPIYEAIQSLEILQKLKHKLEFVNSKVILFIFMLLFILVEGLGIYAGMLFVSGYVMSGVVLYISKIPIAAFTFWLFRVTEDKLMEFEWFAKTYKLFLKLIVKIKSLEFYKKTIEIIKKFKIKVRDFKEKYFSDKSIFIEKIRNLYKSIKSRAD